MTDLEAASLKLEAALRNRQEINRVYREADNAVRGAQKHYNGLLDQVAQLYPRSTS